MNRAGFSVLAMVLFAGLSGPAPGGSINTSQILARTTAAAPSCMQWMTIGTCFWLRCTWRGCRVRSSLKIGHYNPDLVVASYNELGGNPWSEIRATLGMAQKTAVRGLLGSLLSVAPGSAGNRTEGSPRSHTNLMFREADAIGHPLTQLPVPGLMCGSQARPFVPYFQSGIDALAWRSALGIRVARLGYAAIGDEIARRGHAEVEGRAFVPRRRKLLLAMRALGLSMGEVPRRLGARLTPDVPTRTLRFADVVLRS